MEQALAEFTRDRSDVAFSQVMRRHVDAVYSQALRQVRDRELAADVTQAVFVLLARKAASIRSDVALGAWLHKATRYACLNAVRAKARRDRHEQKAAQMRTEIQPTSEPTWAQAEPMLDVALAKLSYTDRQAVVLRFFESRSMREIGEALGITENTAKQRVGRALEKLRKLLARGGVAVPAATLALWLEQNAVVAAPASVVTSIASASSSSPAAVSLANATSTTLLTRKVLMISGATGLLAGIVVASGLAVSQLKEQQQHQQRPQRQDIPGVLLAQAGPAANDSQRAAPADEAEAKAVLAALQGFVDGVEQADAEKVRQTVHYPDTAERPIMESLIELHVPISRLSQLWAERFGGEVDGTMQSVGLQLHHFPKVNGNYEALVKRTLERVQPSDVHVTGDRASVPIRVTGEEMGLQPDKDTRDHHVYLRKVDGAWRIDVERSMPTVAHVQRANGEHITGVEAAPIFAQFTPKFRDLINSISDELENDDFHAPEQVAQRFRRGFLQIDDELRISGIWHDRKPQQPHED